MRIVEGEKESFADLASGAAYFVRPGWSTTCSTAGSRELIFVEVELIS